LAHHGPDVYRDDFELVLRRESAHANDIWQADHTELDVMGAGRDRASGPAVADRHPGRQVQGDRRVQGWQATRTPATQDRLCARPPAAAPALSATQSLLDGEAAN